MPVGRPVTARATGTRARSYKMIDVRMVRPVMTWNDAGGILNVAWSVVPCLVKYVLNWDIDTANIKQVNQIGMSWTTSFTSSTWLLEHSLHGSLFSVDASFSSIIIAFSKNLISRIHMGFY